MRYLLVFLLAGFSLKGFSQSDISFTSSLEPVEIAQDHITFSWNTDSNCNCELFTGTEKSNLRSVKSENNKKSFTATVSGLEPSTLIYAALKCQNQNSRFESEPIPFITASASTGKIKVYFNHSVNTLVSTGTNAQSLYGLVDDTLIAHMNRATETMDIAIYNASASSSLSDIAAAINAAHNRGVKVRIIYEGDNTNSLIPNISSSISKVASPTGFSYGIMHNKFVIIDANSTNANKPLVWTGSTNWTVAQLNGPDLNHVVTIQDKSLALAYQIEFEEMWGGSAITPNASASKFGPYKTNNTPHNFNIGGVPVELYFSPSDGVNGKIIEKIATATYDLEIGSMIITKTDIASAITAQFNSGVGSTHMVVDDSTGTTTWSTLRGAMGSNRVKSHNGISGIMHHKFMIVDALEPLSDPTVLTGSHNWSNSAETRNDENTLVIHDATIANIFYQAFTEIFDDAGGVLSVRDDSNESLLNLYPVPVSDVLNVEIKVESEYLITVMSLTGQVVKEMKGYGNKALISVAGLPDAAYIVKVKTGSDIRNYRVIVNH